MLLAGVVIILACICLLFLNFSIFMLGLFVYPLLFLQTNYIQQLLFAKEQVKGALLLQLVEKISWLMIFPLEAFIPNGLSLFILPIILGSLVHVGIGNVLLRRIEESNDTLKNGTNTKLYFGIQSLVTDLGMLDTVLVGFFASTSNAGVYNLGARVRSPFLLLFNSLIANLKKSFAEHDIEKTKALIYHERFLIFIFYSSIPVTSIVLYFKGTSIFGNDFTSLNKCLSISVLSVIPQSLLLMGANFLSSAGKEKFISHFSSTFTFANLIFLSFGLIKYDFTALDAAVYFFFATVVGTLVVMYKAVTLWKFLMSSNVKRAFNDH
jgi:O-antigen/teichoic acid export membrane protein